MPKVVGYTAPWLSRPAPGSQIFSDPSPESPTSPSKQRTQFSPTNNNVAYQGPKRLIARRGTEIFTVVGNKIRWANLVAVKDLWGEKSQVFRGKSSVSATETRGSQFTSAGYRTLSVPVYYQIRQLVISPSGVFLAICTEHTVHIAVLPDSSRLQDHDRSPLKLKTHQLGPTTHVIPESPIISALWHPLALSTSSTDCFVTITAEAAVRVWELDRASRSSFERPAVAIDLKRLVDGVSSDDDFEPSGFGKSRGFSVDAFDMEASAACFGGQAHEDENAWASMTLWTTMRNGDIYALCPLLPSRWLPTESTIPSLSTSVVSKLANLHGSTASADEERAAQQQYEWVQEIDSNEPLYIPFHEGSDPREVRLRPSNPSAIPRLQGPFEMALPEELVDLEVSDIHVFPAKLDETDFMSGEDEYADSLLEDEEGPSFSIICLATISGVVHVAMDMEGVSGQWLPKKGRNSFSVPVSDTPELVLVESLTAVSRPAEKDMASSWPIFTSDVKSRCGLFLSSSKQIASISFADWSSRLSMELASPEADETGAGLATRLKTTCQSQICVTDELLNIADNGSDPADDEDALTAPIVFNDPNLGYMLLTSTPSEAYSISFDTSHLEAAISYSPSRSQRSPTPLNAQIAAFETPESPIIPQRAPYTPHPFFYKSATAPMKDFLSMNVAQRQRVTLKQGIRLSPATLDVMRSAHRTLSAQTSQLEKSAAELFRKCERMREELGDQVKQMAELAEKLQQIGGHGEEVDKGRSEGKGKAGHEERIKRAQQKQKDLVKRFETLRRMTGRVGSRSRELSEKEVGWIEEVARLGEIVGVEKEEPGEEDDGEGEVETEKETGGLKRRFQTVKQIADELISESKRIVQETSIPAQREDSASPGMATLHPPSRLQKAKLADVMAMVEREGAVIEAVMARLERLNEEYSA